MIIPLKTQPFCAVWAVSVAAIEASNTPLGTLAGEGQSGGVLYAVPGPPGAINCGVEIDSGIDDCGQSVILEQEDVRGPGNARYRSSRLPGAGISQTNFGHSP